MANLRLLLVDVFDELEREERAAWPRLGPAACGAPQLHEEASLRNGDDHYQGACRKHRRKLQAVCNPKKNRPHDLYVVYHEGRPVAHFGVRRSSKKDQGTTTFPVRFTFRPIRQGSLGNVR